MTMEKKNIEIGVPPKAAYIIDALQAHGFEGYVVGGCVRDAILGRTANDWDITTPALPDDIHRIFPHTVDTGVAHGTVTVLVDREPFEVTTYRIDGVYEDGRHPREVFFTPRLSEDLRRRDFTINAMAWSRRSGLVDLFGGMEDLQAGLIRCVGEPRERIGEDALRMMRAVRFAAQLGFALEEGTAEAVAEMAPSLAKISAERICAELVKLLVSGSPEMIDTARQLGLTAVFLPEFDALFDQPTKGPHHDQPDVGRHTLKVLMQTPPEKTLRLAALLHDVGKPATAKCSPEGRDTCRLICLILAS